MPPSEPHFTVRQIADQWGLDSSTVRKMFIDEPGVLKISENRRGVRTYTTLRIPESIVERVHKRRCL